MDAIEQDWRFAELVALSWIEPALSLRYAQNPSQVLAEFGLHVAGDVSTPALPPAPQLALVIEDFTGEMKARGSVSCFCAKG
ncbi:hypothetical protein G3I60_26170 [Streptomyces sp. SID13666]|uniref:hypothetical protein n=1 Tax=Streptomyces TaxID=1883 RepID=UPI00110676DA|nr:MULTISPECIES: hypothetical protein [Streptomyces]NEA57546.1 hypothetical protein [Streptomyces sp. SID13666]NEA70950.1 hypothetical protein [Streptomyces sp. SID13588]QNA76715.1 hypothetical protein C8250_036945 [Streptomyces sp. So13.3]